MNRSQQAKFDTLYAKHVSALKRQGKADKTVEAYSLAVRRLSKHFDSCLEDITHAQLETYFDALIRSHSWATVKCDRNGLQFFFEHVLKRPWNWVNLVKPPQVRSLPDILTLKEIEQLINAAHELRYQTFILVAFSMGLRIGEVLNLKIGDIDKQRMQVHIRQGKGKKDRFVTLPQRPYDAMRRYWATHRNSPWIFPNGRTNEERHDASTCMDRSGVQRAFKAIALSCGIHKHVTPHTLRHCYGALLLEAGVSLRAIQEQMGHECPKTTALYTQLTRATEQNTGQRLDAMLASLQITWGV
jgi:integrase/recombinase XerD